MCTKKESTDPSTSVAADANQPIIQDTYSIAPPRLNVNSAPPKPPPGFSAYTVTGKTLNVNSQYIRTPKWLLSLEISGDAKTLYISMLGLLSVSAQNQGKWVINGEPYIYYSIQAVQKMLHCGHSKASDLFSELTRHHLIRRVRQGQGKPAKVFLYHPLPTYNKGSTSASADVLTPAPADVSALTPMNSQTSSDTVNQEPDLFAQFFSHS